MRAVAEEAVHERNHDAEHHQPRGSRVGREQEAEYGSAHCGTNDLPFAFIPFRDGAPEQGPNGKGEGDEKRDLSTSRRIAILSVHERWQPVSETVEGYRLEEMKDCQHDDAPAVWRTKYLGKTRLAHTRRRRCVRCRQRTDKVRLCMPVKQGGNTFSIPHEAIPGKPARRLRKEAAEYPNGEGARSAYHNEPPPPLNVQGVVRHKQPAQQSEYRNGRLDDRERKGKRSSAKIAWNYLRRIGVDGNQLSADRNRTDHAYGIDSDGRVLHGHQGRRHSVAKCKASKSRTSPTAVSDSAQTNRSYK